MVDHFQEDMVDRHPEMVVILAGTNLSRRPSRTTLAMCCGD
jgi:hypothetical protein